MKRLIFLLSLSWCVAAHAAEWIPLFDASSTDGSLDGWKMSGPGSFVMDTDGTIKSQGGMGLFYYAEQQFADFELEVEWRVANAATNSGIFVRFPSGADPWDAVEGGYEIQIDDSQQGIHQTGGVYSFAAPARLASKPVGEWNTFVVRVQGQQYQITLNGEVVTEFVGNRARRGYIGLQNHDDNSVVWFKKVRVRPLTAKQPSMQTLANAFRVTGEREPIDVLTVTATHGYRHEAAIETTKNLLAALAETTEFNFTVTENVDDLNAANLADYDLLFLANATLRVDEPTADSLPQQGVLTFRAGDWRNYTAAIKTPERDITGRIALSGQPGDLTGMAEFNTGPRIIEDISLQQDQLRMRWDAGEGIGVVVVTAALSSSGLHGEMAVGDLKLPVEGVAVDTAQQVDWDVVDPVTAAHRGAIVGFLENGGGLVGAHSALDAFYGWGEYRRMVGGGLFESHPWTQRVRIDIEDTAHAAVAHLGDGLSLRDEIYVLDRNPRWNAHVLASLDTTSVGIEQGPADGSRNDFPISWVREHKGGKVFMTKLGHFPDVWTNPLFIQHLLQGMRIAAGRLPGSRTSARVKETIASGVWPDDIAVDERGNVWIAELRGKLHRYDAESGATAQIGHLETTDPTKIEHGLLGIEVDPEFYAGQPYVYLYFTERESFINTLARYRYTDGRLDLESPEVLLRVPTEPQCCHQAGDLEWGLDGTLYLSTGDTGMSETRPEWEITAQAIEAFKDARGLKDHHWSRLADSERTAQNLQDLRGKIIRINKDGTIPRDNPFFGDPGVRWEIYAYGLRNPYRFKVHPETGDLYIGVVGPDARYDYDEYNISIGGGENFGWPRSIGKLFYNDWTPDDIPNYRPPLWEYTYATGGRSASVGPIYMPGGRGANFPDVFRGKLIISDWARRWIKWADVVEATFTNDRDADARVEPLQVEIPAYRLSNIRDFDQLAATAPISIELGPDGSLYVAEFDGFWDAGPNSQVSRYRWSDAGVADAPPTQERAAFSAGASVYNTRCASCHQASGEGVSGVFPPLTGTERVLGDKAGLIKVIREGVSGELQVNGVTYNGAMPGWAATLSAAEIAAVLTHIRSSWGNDAAPVTVDDVNGAAAQDSGG